MAKIAKTLQFKIIIEQDEDGLYVASVSELPGCYTQGKTLEEARKRIKQVIALTLESDAAARRAKIASPKPASRFFGVEDLQISYA